MTVGTCQHCRREQQLEDDRHIATHPRRFSDTQCPGSGELSMEATASNAVKARERLLVRIERLRADAAIAHDLLANQVAGERYVWPASQILAMRKAALQEYRIKFGARVPRRLWFFVGRKRGRHASMAPADVYCTLCRELLIQRGDRGRDYTDKTREHTTLCALRRLAGIAEYVAPGELRLPEALRADDVAVEAT